jgi:hypothetical protein
MDKKPQDYIFNVKNILNMDFNANPIPWWKKVILFFIPVFKTRDDRVVMTWKKLWGVLYLLHVDYKVGWPDTVTFQEQQLPTLRTKINEGHWDNGRGQWSTESHWNGGKITYVKDEQFNG